MKNNFFCKNYFINIYERPSHISKVSSQILYGEKFKILSKNKNWLKIKTLFDGYNGYIKKANYTNIHRPTHKIFKLKANIFKKPIKKKIFQTNNFLPFASQISIIKRK